MNAFFHFHSIWIESRQILKFKCNLSHGIISQIILCLFRVRARCVCERIESQLSVRVRWLSSKSYTIAKVSSKVFFTFANDTFIDDVSLRHAIVTLNYEFLGLISTWTWYKNSLKIVKFKFAHDDQKSWL